MIKADRGQKRRLGKFDSRPDHRRSGSIESGARLGLGGIEPFEQNVVDRPVIDSGQSYALDLGCVRGRHATYDSSIYTY
jgi:hypothetical protein